MPGCGKTSFGEALSERLGLPFYDTDENLELMRNASIPDIFEREGEEAFRAYETESLKDVLAKPGGVISTGGGIVKLEANRELLRSGTVVFIDRSVEDILSDLDSDSRPLLADNRDRIYKLHEERYELYKKSADYLVSNNEDFERVLDKLVEILKGEVA